MSGGGGRAGCLQNQASTGRSAWPAPLTAGSQLSLLAVGQHMASTGLTKPRLTNRVLWLIIEGCWNLNLDCDMIVSSQKPEQSCYPLRVILGALQASDVR